MVKGFKKGLSVALAAAMVFSTPIAVQQADVVKAASTHQTPILSFDFDSGTSGEGTYTENQVKLTLDGKAAVAADPDDATNKALSVDPTNDGSATTKGNGDRAKTDLGVFGTSLDGATGVTVSLKVRPTKQFSDWNYIFRLGHGLNDDVAAEYKKWAYIDGTIGFIQRMDGGNKNYIGYFPGGAWVPGCKVREFTEGKEPENPYDYFCYDKNCGEWHTLTYVFSDEEMAIYMDGLKCVSHEKGAGIQSVKDYINAVKAGMFVIGAGPDLTEGENFTGYIDDVKVYASALDSSEVYYAATGEEAKVDAMLSGVDAVITADNKVKISYTEKAKPDSVTVKVNDKDVAATEGENPEYLYEPAADDKELKISVTASKSPDATGSYLDQTITKTVKIAKEGDKLLFDEDIASDLKVDNGSDAYTITWKTSDDSVKSALTVTGNGKTYTGDKSPYALKYADLTDGAYKVTLVATKDGNTKREFTADINYKKVESTAGDKPGTNFANITTQPVAKYVFDGKDTDLTLSSKATLTTDGYLKLADKVGSHGEYYAQIADLSKNDFSKGFTWTMDVKVADYNADARWTSLFTFGDGVLGKGLDGANSNVAYHYTLGLDNILDFKAGFVSGSTKGGKLGWYGAGQFVNDAANGMGEILAAPAAPYSYAWYEDSTKRNRWDTIAGTVAEDGTMSIYYDGTLMATYKDDSYKNILEAMKKATTNYLGETYWNGATQDNDFAGYIDNVGIYNSALSADDIKKLTASAADTTTPSSDTPTTTQADGKTAAIAFTDGPTVSANRKKITAEFSVKPDKVTATGTNTVKISGKKVTITYKKALKIGKKIKVTATKGTSSKSKTVTVKGTFTISGVKAKKNTKKITGKVNVKKATVKVKVGKKKYKKATVKGKKFTFKTSKLKKGTKVIIKVTKKNYKTKTKTVKVK